MKKEQKSKKEQKQEKKQAKKATKPGQLITFTLKSNWNLADIADWKERITQLRNAIQTKRKNIQFSKTNGLDTLLISYKLDIDLKDGDQFQQLKLSSNHRIKLNKSNYLIVTLDIISLYPFKHIQVFQKTTKKGEVYIPNKCNPVKKTDITNTLKQKQVTDLQNYFNYEKWSKNQLNLSQVCGILIAEQVRFSTFEIYQTRVKNKNSFQIDVMSLIKNINKLIDGIPQIWENKSKVRGQQIFNLMLPQQRQKKTILQKEAERKYQLYKNSTDKSNAYKVLVQPLIKEFFKEAIKPIPVTAKQNDKKLVFAINVMYVQSFIKRIEHHAMFKGKFET